MDTLKAVVAFPVLAVLYPVCAVAAWIGMSDRRSIALGVGVLATTIAAIVLWGGR